jgi:hypothetical protein
MDRNSVKQYRLHLVLDGQQPSICELTASDPQVLKDRAQFLLHHVLGDGGRIEPVQSEGVTQIFHPKWHRGLSPLGWIYSETVPETIGVGATIERLREEGEAAA